MAGSFKIRPAGKHAAGGATAHAMHMDSSGLMQMQMMQMQMMQHAHDAARNATDGVEQRPRIRVRLAEEAES